MVYVPISNILGPQLLICQIMRVRNQKHKAIFVWSSLQTFCCGVPFGVLLKEINKIKGKESLSMYDHAKHVLGVLFGVLS